MSQAGLHRLLQHGRPQHAPARQPGPATDGSADANLRLLASHGLIMTRWTLYASEAFGVELDQWTYALDATAMEPTPSRRLCSLRERHKPATRWISSSQLDRTHLIYPCRSTTLSHYHIHPEFCAAFRKHHCFSGQSNSCTEYTGCAPQESILHTSAT